MSPHRKALNHEVHEEHEEDTSDALLKAFGEC